MSGILITVLVFVDGPGLDYFINKANSERLSKVMPKIEEINESSSAIVSYGDGLKGIL